MIKLYQNVENYSALELNFFEEFDSSFLQYAFLRIGFVEVVQNVTGPGKMTHIWVHLFELERCSEMFLKALMEFEHDFSGWSKSVREGVFYPTNYPTSFIVEKLKEKISEVTDRQATAFLNDCEVWHMCGRTSCGWSKTVRISSDAENKRTPANRMFRQKRYVLSPCNFWRRLSLERNRYRGIAEVRRHAEGGYSSYFHSPNASRTNLGDSEDSHGRVKLRHQKVDLGSWILIGTRTGRKRTSIHYHHKLSTTWRKILCWPG